MSSATAFPRIHRTNSCSLGLWCKNSWNVKKEIQPVDNNVVKNITQTKLTVIKEGDEEKAIPDNVQLAEVEYVSDQDDAGNSPQKCKKKVMKIHFVKWISRV
jgi:hypothetical protein